MKVLSGHDFIKSTKDKQSFLLLVSEEELQAVKEILEEKEEHPLRRFGGDRRSTTLGIGRRQEINERREFPKAPRAGRRSLKERRSS